MSQSKSAVRKTRAFETTNPQILRTRASILDTTRNLLINEGYRSITVDKISSDSGASRSTIYRHWPQIDDLLFDAFSTVTGESIEPPDSGDFRQDIQEINRHFAESVGRVWVELLPSFIEAAQHDEHCAELLKQQEEAAREPIKKVLIRARRRGELGTDAKIEWILDAIAGPTMYRALLTDRPFAEKGFLRFVIDAVTR